MLKILVGNVCLSVHRANLPITSLDVALLIVFYNQVLMNSLMELYEFVYYNALLDISQITVPANVYQTVQAIQITSLTGNQEHV